MSSEYSDDFEDYTDDFEAYESDKDEDDAGDEEHVRQKPGHAPRRHEPSPPPLSRPLSAAKTITKSTSPPRGGLAGAAPAPNTFAHGVRAPQGFGLGTMGSRGGTHPAISAKAAAAAESTRIKAIRKLVTFEYVNFTLLDMPPKSRYELALLASARVDGNGNRFLQKETQTGSDLIELAVQTEEVSTMSTGTQCPDDVEIVAPSAAGGVGKEAKKDKKKGSSKRTNAGLEWTPQLTRFVIGASQVFDCLLTAAAETTADEVHDPHAGLVELFTLPIPRDHTLTTMHTPTYHPHLLAFALCPRSSSTDARSIIHITSLKSATTSPTHVLTGWGTLSTVSISPHPRWLVLAGTTDGAILAWDLRKTSTSRRNVSEPVWASYSLLVPPHLHSIGQEDEAGKVPDPIHSAPIVSIHHLTDRSLVTVDEHGKAAVWGISVSPTIALVPVTSPTAMSLFPAPPCVRRASLSRDLDPVPYPVVTALDASASLSIGLLAATATGSIVRAPGALLVTSTAGATDLYALPKSAASVTRVAVVARQWVVVGTAAGHVCVFHASRGAVPEVVWNVHEHQVQEDVAGVVDMDFPGAEGSGGLKRVVVVTREWVVSWQTEQGKWDMQHVVRVARNKASLGKEVDLVGMAAGRMAVWEPARSALVVYNLPVA